MQFLIIDGTSISSIEANSKAEAAAKYGRRRLPPDARAKLFRLRVLDLSLATEFNCVVTRGEDHIESTAKEIYA